ncbi:MAG: hypothetical protein LBQ77_08630 [Treponema sp.]|jgi:hypothetical protein|nr:hypothetical protein [Treponema sp.]
MNLTERNTTIRLEILFASLIVIAAIPISIGILPFYPSAVEHTNIRPEGLFQIIAAHIFQSSVYMPYISIIFSIVYACIGLLCIYQYFEKTHSLEIFFFSFFLISFSFEILRIVPVLMLQFELEASILAFSFRILLFARYFGLFSLFIASVYASGWDSSRQNPPIFIIVVAVLILVLYVPVDGMTWNKSLNAINGLKSVFSVVENGCILITVSSFLIASYIRRERSFIQIGIGSLLLLWGRDIILNADTVIGPLVGSSTLIIGSWFFCTKLHKIYLWL